MSRKTEMQVGVTVLVALAILGWGVAWLSTYAKAHALRVWHATFAQAGGLAEGNAVHVNGVRKGAVRSMRLRGDHVIVDLALDKDITLTHDSRVAVRTASMMGEKIIAVDYRATGEPWEPTDTIPGVFEKGLPEVMADVGAATGSIRSISVQLDSLAAAMEQGGGLKSTVASFHRTSAELEAMVSENRAALRSTVQNFSATSGAAKDVVVGHQEQMKASIDHFASAAENLDRLTLRLDSLRAEIQITARRLNQGDGTLGRLVRDEKLYDELNTSVLELRALLRDMQRNPRKYFKFSVF